MSEQVKRYDAVHIRYEDNNIRYGEGCEVEVVTARDYDALEAECSRLRAALGQYADDNNWCYDTCNISRDVAKDALAAGGGCI